MSNMKILITLMGLLLAVTAVCKTDLGKPVIENWWGGTQFTSTAVPEIVAPNGARTALGGNYFDPSSMRGSGRFVSTPSYQAVLSPRFSNVQYGANIKYNMPDRQNLAAPCDPLTFGDMARENYNQKRSDTKENYGCSNSSCGSSDVSCGKGGYGISHKVAGDYQLPAGYTNGNYMDIYNNMENSEVVSRPCEGDSSDNSSLPIGTMNAMDAAGNTEQFVVMDRLMATNMKSKLRALGDPIRGDLPITPDQNSGWFSVYPTINVDLQPGAMNVLAGQEAGETNAKLMQLLMNASGGSRTTFGGVNFADMSSAPSAANMTPQYQATLSAANTDVQFSSYP